MPINEPVTDNIAQDPSDARSALEKIDASESVDDILADLDMSVVTDDTDAVIKALGDDEISVPETTEPEPAPIPAQEPAPTPARKPIAPLDDDGLSYAAYLRALDFATGGPSSEHVAAILDDEPATATAELTASDIEAALALEDAEIVGVDPTRHLSLIRESHPKATPRRLAELRALLERARDHRKARKQRKAARRASRYRERRKAVGASPPKIVKTSSAKWARDRLRALLRATADPKGDKRLMKLRGREDEIVSFLEWREALGKDATRANIARCMRKTPDGIKNLTDLVAKLERPGQPWEGMA